MVKSARKERLVRKLKKRRSVRNPYALANSITKRQKRRREVSHG